MGKLIVFAGALVALHAFSIPAGAQNSMRGFGPSKWTYVPHTCVHVWMFRSRQTRYAGAARCRRVPA